MSLGFCPLCSEGTKNAGESGFLAKKRRKIEIKKTQNLHRSLAFLKNDPFSLLKNGPIFSKSEGFTVPLLGPKKPAVHTHGDIWPKAPKEP